MSDRLVAVDLLGPAADLLNYQITKRLDGVARAQVATRLAMIYLMDQKPQNALAGPAETANCATIAVSATPAFKRDSNGLFILKLLVGSMRSVWPE